MTESRLREKTEALAAYFNVRPDEIYLSCGTIYSHHAFLYGDCACLVLTDEEADAAAYEAVKERLWLISMESVFEYFGIDEHPEDVPDITDSSEIRKVNEGLAGLFEKSCGSDALAKRMLELGNRANILADFDHEEIFRNGFYIYRLY